MMKTTILTIAIFLVGMSTTTTAAGGGDVKFKKHLRNYPTLPTLFESADPSTISFVTQRQDHFDGSNPNTWKQAYYVNDTFWKGEGPVFLCVGGVIY